ncbi:B12-binding domain-containing radical SAM protein [Thermodesulfobacteriota bacterium]
MPKALLIHATDPTLELAEQPGMPFPVLGVTTVAALFPETWEVSIIDEDTDQVDIDFKADLVGISTLTIDAPHAYELADSFKKKGAAVVMGGMHASALPEEALEHCDAVVVGEAEGIFDKLLDDFYKGSMNGIYRGKQVDLSLVPPPRFDLLGEINRKRFQTVQATRGCPHNCEFCSVTPFFGHKYRTRQVSSVIEEIERILDFGRSNIVFFVDDNISGSPHYAKELFQALIPLNIKWGSFASVAMTNDKELMELAKKSGCIELFIGFESIHQINLDASSKRWVKADEMKTYVEIFHDYGIIVEGAFIFGHDHDEKDVFRKTVDFVQYAGIQVPIFGVLTPHPATRLRERLIKEGRLLSKARDWRLYDGSHVLFRPANMSPEELEEGFLWAKKYCCAPRSIFKRMFRAPKANWLMALALNFSMRGGRMKQIKKRWPKKRKGPLVGPSSW